MQTLLPAMITLLAPFAPLFSPRIWRHALVLVAGTLRAPGKRTVCAALRAMGLSQSKRFTRLCWLFIHPGMATAGDFGAEHSFRPLEWREGDAAARLRVSPRRRVGGDYATRRAVPPSVDRQHRRRAPHRRGAPLGQACGEPRGGNRGGPGA